MSADSLIDCPVEFHAGVNKFGIFANSFRITGEQGQECFLDFCVYSKSENKAEVVSRLRIHISFLPVMVERLKETMLNITPIKKPGAGPAPENGEPTEEEFVLKDGMLQTADGRIAWFTRGKDDPQA